LLRVFLYHQAAAIPPASAEAPAIIPSLNQPGVPGLRGCTVDEVEESKELVMDRGTIFPARRPVRAIPRQAISRWHDSKSQMLRSAKIISIFVFAFFLIYAIVYLFQS
jgi:hypothetical protein